MPETTIGLLDHGAEVGPWNGPVDERRHHRFGDIGIGATGERAQLLWRQLRPALRHVKALIARRAAEQHVLEAARRRFATRRDVAQVRSYSLWPDVNGKLEE